jgi:hypothetical protein
MVTFRMFVYTEPRSAGYQFDSSRVTYSFRMNTCKSVSKQTTLTPFRMNTYEKHRGWGVLLLATHPIRMRNLPAPLFAGSERSELRILHPGWFYGTKDLSSHPVKGVLLSSTSRQTLRRSHVQTLSSFALVALSPKSVWKLLCSQHVPHSFLKQPGVCVFFPFRFTQRGLCEGFTQLAPSSGGAVCAKGTPVLGQRRFDPSGETLLFTSHESRVTLFPATGHESHVTFLPPFVTSLRPYLFTSFPKGKRVGLSGGLAAISSSSG